MVCLCCGGNRAPRLIDGFSSLTKFDTIDDKVTRRSVYIYIYIYFFLCIYIYIYIYINIYICTYIYVFIYICMYIYINMYDTFGDKVAHRACVEYGYHSLV